MSEAINAHKKMAMGMTSGNKMKTGGVARFAEGGLANLPAKGTVAPIPKGTGAKIATMKRGGGARGR